MATKHALIIDDNLKNATILAHLLTAQQVGNTQIVDIRQLDKVLANLNKVDIVFLDLEMPVDGFEVLKQLKANPKFQAVPIVAYTVHISEIKIAYRRGFDGFIGKPLDSDKFPDQLARILRGEGFWEIS